MRTTKQKKILQEAVSGFGSFFNANHLQQKAQLQDRNIGLATAYRFLKDLENSGKIHAYLCSNRKIYSTKKNNHIHFTCEKCNLIRHLKTKKIDFLQEIIGDQICHIQIDIAGICKDCN